MKAKQEYEQWKAMGDEIKQIRNSLIKFICNPEYQRLTTVALLEMLSKSVDRIDKFRHKAEERMFKKARPPRDEAQKWFNVFYGKERERE